MTNHDKPKIWTRKIIGSFPVSGKDWWNGFRSSIPHINTSNPGGMASTSCQLMEDYEYCTVPVLSTFSPKKKVYPGPR